MCVVCSVLCDVCCAGCCLMRAARCPSSLCVVYYVVRIEARCSLFGGRSLLSAVCCLLFVAVRWWLAVGRRLLLSYAVCWLLSATCCLLCVMYCGLFVVRCLWLVVCRLLFVVCCSLVVVRWSLLAVRCVLCFVCYVLVVACWW